ncbi:unnamed protein product [Durusdinium trenchii]|uniref:Reverse transcriptase domain-containing protein n=1 Tax=Durusdinium trenchii TaxID=1381693 RepID=A0ABP0SKV6_9DINO
MALSLLPTPTELAGLGDLAAIRLWTGLGEDVWDAASRDLGGIPNVRMFAFVPADTFRDMLARVRIPVRASGSGAPPAPRECSAIELVQLAVMWRVARQAYGLPDWDILSPTPPAHVTAAAGTTTAGEEKNSLDSSFAETEDEFGAVDVHDNDVNSDRDDFSPDEQWKETRLRKFVFGEFFAGMGGFSTAVLDICETHVKLGSLERLDAYDQSWDILNDEDYVKAKELCNTELDHGHFAPPCRTLTEARRTDKHGFVPILRSASKPEGWGDEQTKEANEIVARTVVLCLMLHSRGKTFSVENPFGSFLWLLKVMQKLMRLAGAELVMLHQCCYGASTPKPTGILTTSPWMKTVRKLCFEVRPHHHLKEGLVGKVWSYLEDKVVWRSSLAAEYPCGLCVAWANALKRWLCSAEGLEWMKAHSMALRGRWLNQLVRGDSVPEKDVATRAVQSQREVREEENSRAIGGLRDARKAVQKSSSLRQTGRRIRRALEKVRNESDLEAWERSVTNGISETLVSSFQEELAKEFRVQIEQSAGFKVSLWRALLRNANDCEAGILPCWMESGFPLGIEEEIKPSGVFPLTTEDSAAVEASRLEGKWMDDQDGLHRNYTSFEDAGVKAQNILEEMVAIGRAQKLASWQEVQSRFGCKARLTKLACIIKAKPDGSEKVRLVVDSRRSGVNGLTKLHERVVLPRATDIGKTWKRLQDETGGWKEAELFSADFANAFNMLQLCQSERPYVIVKGHETPHEPAAFFCFSAVMFGLAPGPLLWGRVAAAAMRLAQAAITHGEAEVSTFVDDPLVVAFGSSQRERTWLFACYSLVWRALGLEMSWNKAQRGLMVDWIGFSFSLQSAGQERRLSVQLMKAKQAKLVQVLNDLLQCKGVLPLKSLQLAVGILGWVTSALPLARPFVAMIWAAILQQRKPVYSSTRVRKGLIFCRQVEHALTWLKALVSACTPDGSTMQKVYRWHPTPWTILIQCDACPTGMGGFVAIAGKIEAFWYDSVTCTDEELLGCKRGDPSHQSELELLTVLVSVKAFQAFVMSPAGPANVLLRVDNTATLAAALDLRGKSPIMAQLAAELAMELEHLGVPFIWGQHVPGVMNDIADRLSRMNTEQRLPLELARAKQVLVPIRDRSYYRSWPPVSQNMSCALRRGPVVMFVHLTCETRTCLADGWV